ncbi:hypothetical protein M501DRAFT_991083 [Patellaria atrata CBS 101060]|uniref:Uncharacterized protein n=1 Tax=Patellaria atrata CBS 101060 TaxID=1346257 RepID=A0A9P4SCN9_9PEZI|nr:hypothetical protein M501DRAFT_991083 [Patellaria atrata CBS 101060]
MGNIQSRVRRKGTPKPGRPIKANENSVEGQGVTFNMTETEDNKESKEEKALSIPGKENKAKKLTEEVANTENKEEKIGNDAPGLATDREAEVGTEEKKGEKEDRCAQAHEKIEERQKYEMPGCRERSADNDDDEIESVDGRKRRRETLLPYTLDRREITKSGLGIYSDSRLRVVCEGPKINPDLKVTGTGDPFTLPIDNAVVDPTTRKISPLVKVESENLILFMEDVARELTKRAEAEAYHPDDPEKMEAFRSGMKMACHCFGLLLGNNDGHGRKV